MNTVAPDSLFKIGEVANVSGLSVKTIRYYEEIGLLTPTVKRSNTGYRLFLTTVLSRLAFIKRAQSLGLALGEIKAILDVHDRGRLPCHEVKQHLHSKIEAINQQIVELELLRSELQGVLSGWKDHPAPEVAARTICPNLQD